MTLDLTSAHEPVQVHPRPVRLFAVALVLAAITFGPALVFYRFTVSSHATGLVIVCAIVLGLWICGVIKVPVGINFWTWLLITTLIIFVLVSHLMISAFFVDIVLERAAQSCLLIMMALLTAQVVSGYLELEENAIPRSALLIMILFLVFGALGALRIQPTGASIALSIEKSVFPFTEPSQFTIAFSPFLIYAVVTSRNLFMRYTWLIVALGLAITLQNLSLVILTMIAAALCLPIWQAIMAGLGLIPFSGAVDVSYYTQRLDLSSQSQSYSSLIYRQGWELSADALARTSGWGIGFQQLGYVPFRSFSADLLRLAIGVDSNVVDGGFTAAKLLSEFGIFGILILIGYLLLAIRSGLRLRTQIDPDVPRLAPFEAFAYSSICGLFIDLFVRGEGYFSGSFLLFEAALFLLWRRRASAQ